MTKPRKRNRHKKKKTDADKQSSASDSQQGSPTPKRRASSVRSRSSLGSERSFASNANSTRYQGAGPSSTQANLNNTASTAGPSTAKIKLPPLVVKQVPLDNLVSSFATMGIAAEYKLTRFGTKVMLRTKAEYELAAIFLKETSAEFFTHDIPGEKPFKVVIRGLPSFDVKTIEAELKDRYKLAPIAVYRMTRRDEATKKYPDCLFLVHFAKGTVTLNSLQAIRSLCSIIIRWETYRGGNRDVTQCQRCLCFGHGTRNCFMSPRCNKCAQAHATSTCPSEDGTFKCANCGGTHQGSDRQCPKREEFKKIRKQASIANQPGRKDRTRAPPALTDANFPALQSRRAGPNPTTPPNNQQPRWMPQHPPTAPAAQPSQADASLLTDEELVFLMSEVLIIKRTCRTRAEQLRAVTAIITNYGS